MATTYLSPQQLKDFAQRVDEVAEKFPAEVVRIRHSFSRDRDVAPVRTQDHEGGVQRCAAALLARVNDNGKIWASSEARSKVFYVQTAFENWAKITTHPAANEYLLSLLIGNKRE